MRRSSSSFAERDAFPRSADTRHAAAGPAPAARERSRPGRWSDSTFGARTAPSGFQPKAQEIQVGGRIHNAQSAVDRETGRLPASLQSVREHGLEDIAGGDILLDSGNRGEKILLLVRLVTASLPCAWRWPWLGMGRPGASPAGQPLHRILVGGRGFWRARSAVTTSRISLRTWSKARTSSKNIRQASGHPQVVLRQLRQTLQSAVRHRRQRSRPLRR